MRIITTYKLPSILHTFVLILKTFYEKVQFFFILNLVAPSQCVGLTLLSNLMLLIRLNSINAYFRKER